MELRFLHPSEQYILFLSETNRIVYIDATFSYGFGISRTLPYVEMKCDNTASRNTMPNTKDNAEFAHVFQDDLVSTDFAQSKNFNFPSSTRNEKYQFLCTLIA